MNPKDYYYKKFRTQFTEFLSKSNAHKHGNEGIYISIKDLNGESLSHIPREDYMLFHCALACTILIDQVMYAHFKDVYPEFQKMTMYPKIEYGISNANVRPWDITHSGIGLTTLERFTNFFVDDLKNFFDTHKIGETTWQKVKEAMLSDKDVVNGSRGEIFKDVLMQV